MRLTRRGWIGASAALTGLSFATGSGAAPSASASAPGRPVGDFQILSPGAGHDYGPALAALRDYALAELVAWGLPGMTLSVTDLDGFTAVLALGWADVDRRNPVSPGHYFQIGSISKSFIALTLLALADEGRVDIDSPVARYLPDAALPPEPISLAQLISHTGGLPADAPIFPRGGDGRLWCGFTPGSHFSYSNTGYTLLGRVIERVTGLPHQAAVTKYVRAKLGLADVRGTISQARRSELAVGYWPWDRTVAASLPGARLEFASWDEEDTPAGSICATSEQMAVYLRAMMRIGRGEASPVLSNASARRFVTPVIPAPQFGHDGHYACGVAVAKLDDAPALHHTGGMMSFSSSFHADPTAGVGCFASVNARNDEYRPRQTTAFAIRLLRAIRVGAPLPTPPDPLAPLYLKDASPFLGRFVGDHGEMVIDEGYGGATISLSGSVGRFFPGGPDRLVTDHPVLARYGLDAVRESGKVVGYWWGDTYYGRDTLRAPPPASEALRPYAGIYLNRDPWIGGGELLVRGGALVVEGLGRIVDHGGWWASDKDSGGLERIRFDALLNGRMQRATISGDDLLRITI